MNSAQENALKKGRLLITSPFISPKYYTDPGSIDIFLIFDTGRVYNVSSARTRVCLCRTL